MHSNKLNTLLYKESFWTVFFVFLRLGLTSFGGPVAHLAYFRDEFVTRRKWLNEHAYADLIALCQFLPGPASSQVGMSVGLLRSGYAGALAAWLGFTLPSALVLILFAIGLSEYGQFLPEGTLQGLKIVAVAVVAQAVWGMASTLCNSLTKIVLMFAVAIVSLLGTSSWLPVIAIAGAGLIGWRLIPSLNHTAYEDLTFNVSLKVGTICLGAFALLLIGLPILSFIFPSQALALIDTFYRAGALVFGGGHVVLPLLQAEVVPQGWVPDDVFLAGYGATQAVPGPLFTFAAFLGASMSISPSGWLGGFLCLICIFLPSFLLVVGTLPFWVTLRCQPRIQTALAGINAGVVGLLLAALYDPIWVSTIHLPRDFILALSCFIVLVLFKQPVWLIVIVATLFNVVFSIFL